MNCFETKAKIGCYRDQSLSAGEMHEIASHLSTCPSCATEFRHLEEIETAVKSGIFAEPQIDYWNGIPKRITSRLGLRTHSSVLTQASEAIQTLVAGLRFRWGLVGAFAVAALLFFITKTQLPEQEVREAVSQIQAEKSSASVSSPESVKTREVVSSKTKSKEITEPMIEEESSLMTGTEIKQEKSQDKPIYLNDDELIALNRIKGKPLREQSVETSSFRQQLYPIPITERIVLLQDEARENENNPLLRTFALDNRNARAPKLPGVSELPDEIKQIRSGFLETLWIVQESQTLQEKKNIWLSYISRESDITYRSLAVYNLALVLANIAEESRNFGDANEARTFFLKHQKALRFQMGDSRFERKLQIFESIIDLY